MEVIEEPEKSGTVKLRGGALSTTLSKFQVAIIEKVDHCALGEP
jgi:hypothetical protein